MAVIKNYLNKIIRNTRLSCPGFIEPMTSVLHHGCHDRMARIGAIELRARKKPVLPSHGLDTARSSDLSLKTKHSYESQSHAMRWCGGAVVECCCGLTSSSSTALWLRITAPCEPVVALTGPSL